MYERAATAHSKVPFGIDDRSGNGRIAGLLNLILTTQPLNCTSRQATLTGSLRLSPSYMLSLSL